jgi:hypothetical protein
MTRTSVPTYAIAAGILVLLSILAGGFAEVYAPGKLIVSGDAAATVRNLHDWSLLYRMSFAGYLVEAICDVTLALIFYVLLKPVSKELALLSAFFGLVSTATFAFAEFFYFAPSLLILGNHYLAVLSSDQQKAFTLVSLSLYVYGGSVFMVFYGIATLLRGWLFFQSQYFPRFLGVLLILAGLSFIFKDFIFVLLPRYDSDFILLPMFVAMFALAAWLLIKGVDLHKWETRAATRTPSL